MPSPPTLGTNNYLSPDMANDPTTKSGYQVNDLGGFNRRPGR